MGVLNADPVLEELIDTHGPLTLEPADDLFARLVRSVVSQQLSTSAATTIHDRLTDEFEQTPTALCTADPERLRSVGLSNRKVDYIQNVASAFEHHGYSQTYFDGVENDAVIDELTAITGVGVWTAKMLLIFGLGRPDVFPIEDLAIRNAMDDLYGSTTTEEKHDIAAQWRPRRSIAALYLWKHYEN